MSSNASSLTETPLHDDALPQTSFSLLTSCCFRALSKRLAWIWIALIAVVVTNVVMRYLFGEGRIEFEEIQWHLYAIGFLFGLASCMDADKHVRVDVLHDRMSLATRCWIELYGLLLLFFPFVISVFLFSLPFVAYSFASGEVSDAPGGLPFRWAMKSVLPVGMLLLLVAGISRLSRVCACLFGWPVVRNDSGNASVD